MKRALNKYFFLSAFGLCSLAVMSSEAQTTDQNYVKSYKAQIPLTGNINAVNNKDQVAEAFEYYDGLGRHLQSISRQASPLGKDVVSFSEYDAYGRKAKSYLPYTSTGTDGSMKTSTQANQSAFYQNLVGLTDGAKAYSLQVFENSDLNRLTKAGSSGNDWQPDATNTYASTDHTVKKSYEFNVAGEVLKWTFTAPDATYLFGKVNAGASGTGIFYPINELTKTKTKDEQGNEVIEHTNKAGQTILKRVQATASVTINDTNYASTYYIYDDYGSLVCVVPPEATRRLPVEYYHAAATDATKDSFLKRWGFRYKYDGRKRMTQKQVPGADPVYMVYDDRDRLILTQDANQRVAATKYWTFTKYDNINRPVLTGIKDTTAVLTQAQMQSVVNTHFLKSSARWSEDYVGSAAGNVHGYTNKAYPVRTGNTLTEVDVNKYLTVTYYDDYSYKAIMYDSASYVFSTTELPGEQAANYFKRLKGLVTGTKIKVLDGGVTGGFTWLKSVSYYNDKARMIQAVSDNYKGGTDRSTMVLDFAGKVLKTKSVHSENDVTWKDNVGIALNGNRLTRTASGSTWGTSGAASRQQLAAGQSGWMEVVTSEISSNKVAGFSDVNTNADITTIDYAFYQNAASLKVYENGVSKATIAGALVPGEVLRIERNGTVIKYKRNGTVVYTSATASNTLLMADAAINTASATITGVRTSFGNTSHTVVRRFSYDHAGRLLKTFHSLDGASEIFLTQNLYNELGQVVDKKLHSDNGGTAFKQSVDYRYNIRGWLTKINESDVNINEAGDPRDLFGMELFYNNQDAGITNSQLFNGNISAMKWSKDQSLGSVKQNAYNYSYDPMNRITAAAFKEKSAGWAAATNNGFSESGYTYDLNGNIKTLIRNDKRGTTGVLDNLVYDYGTTTTASNKLLKVTDGGDDFGGFVDGTNTGNDYTYDVNGSMITDQNKGLTTAITYNYLNLPELVTKAGTGGNNIRYIYDASGRKLSQVVSFSGVQKQTDYAGEYQYENDLLQHISHEEGRIVMSSVKTFFSDAGESVTSYTASNATLTAVTLNGTEKYIKAVSTGTTVRSGVFPVGGIFPASGGERYKIRVKGYRDKGTAASSSPAYLLVKADGVDVDWPGAALPISLTTAQTESWIEQIVTIPAGATSLQAGVVWNSVLAGEALYINEIEMTQLSPPNSSLSIDATTGGGYSQYGGGIQISPEIINNQSYVKVACVMTGASTTGVFPIGGIISVIPGKTYTYSIKGYRTTATNANLYIQNAATGTDILWPGAMLPSGLVNAGFVSNTFTVPSGVTSIKLGVLFVNPVVGDAFYVVNARIDEGTKRGSSAEYQYSLKDHLGNVRVTFTSKRDVEVSLATYEPDSVGKEQNKFLRYSNSKRINAVIFDHTHLTNGGSASTVYSNDFSSSLSPLFSDATTAMSLSGGRLKASNVGQWNNVNFYQNTVAGHHYRISFDIDLAGGSQVTSLSHDANQGYTSFVTMNSNGHYSYEFTSITNQTLFFFQNGPSGPRDYYLDNIIIEDLSPLGTGSYSQRLNGSANEKFGLAKSLSVMPGDTVRAEVYASYLSPPNWGWGSIFANMVSQIAAGTPGVVVDGAGLANSSVTFPFGGLPPNTPENAAAPKAYLNWLIFDRNGVMLDGGFKQINVESYEMGNGKLQEHMMSPDILITKPGYVYIYLSNEEPETAPVEVYFDDFKVTHVKSSVVQTDDYYPFGLAFNSYQRENSVANQYQYNGKELQDELNLGWMDYGARMYGPDLGRWTTGDPMSEEYHAFSLYSYCYNNPIRFIDPTGMIVEDNDGIVKGQKEWINKTLGGFAEVLKLTSLDSKTKEVLEKYKSALAGQLNEITTLEESDQTYSVSYQTGAEGGVGYDLKADKVTVGIGKAPGESGVGLISHELTHAYQFETGKISIGLKGGDGSLADITDETAGYNSERLIASGIEYFNDPKVKWNDQNTRSQGKTMTPQAYQGLPSGAIEINSIQGVKMRLRTSMQGMYGIQPTEVYKGWQTDYNAGKKTISPND
ncbi:hypothetical protein BH09BAC3_BH09BAC3_28490 [soil metagenome]